MASKTRSESNNQKPFAQQLDRFSRELGETDKILFACTHPGHFYEPLLFNLVNFLGLFAAQLDL